MIFENVIPILNKIFSFFKVDKSSDRFKSLNPLQKALLTADGQETLKFCTNNLEPAFNVFNKIIERYELQNETNTANRVYKSYDDNKFRNLTIHIHNGDTRFLDEMKSNFDKLVSNKEGGSVLCGVHYNEIMCCYNMNTMITLPILFESIIMLKTDLFGFVKNNNPLTYDLLEYKDMSDVIDFCICKFKDTLYHENRHADQKRYQKSIGSYQFVKYVQNVEHMTMAYKDRPSEIDAFNHGGKQLNAYRSKKITKEYTYESLYSKFLKGFKEKDQYYKRDVFIYAYDCADEYMKKHKEVKQSEYNKHRICNQILRDIKRKNPNVFIGSHAYVDMGKEIEYV